MEIMSLVESRQRMDGLSSHSSGMPSSLADCIRQETEVPGEDF